MENTKPQASSSKMLFYFFLGSIIMGANIFILGVALQ